MEKEKGESCIMEYEFLIWKATWKIITTTSDYSVDVLRSNQTQFNLLSKWN